MSALNKIPGSHVEEWLAQFDTTDRWVPERLLKHLRFYDVADVSELLEKLYALVTQHAGSGRVLFVPCGSVASSATAMIYLFRQVNHVSPSKFIALEKLNREFPSVDAVILLDDFAGTGHSVIRLWSDHIAALQAENPRCKFIFGCMVAHDAAIAALHAQTGFILEVADVIPTQERAFDDKSVIFPSEPERSRAKLVLEKYSKHVPSKGILGYGGTQALVGFFFNTPDNTFPLLWMSSDNWQPLLRRSADPMQFIEELAGGRGPTLPATNVSMMAIQEFNKLDRPEIDADCAILLLKEFSTTIVIERLQSVIGTLNLKAQALSALLYASQKLRHAVHEQHPIRTAIFIVPESVCDAVRQRCYMTPAEPTFLHDEQALRQLCELVDGLQGAVVASSAGEILGAILYSGRLSSPGLPSRLVQAAAESKSLGGLGFVFVGNGRVMVLANGERVFTHRHTTWYPLQSRFLEIFQWAEKRHDIRDGVLRAIYALALDMSDSGEGAIFVVGDESSVLNVCDSRPSTITWNTMTFDATSLPSIRVLAKQDGATIIGADGRVVRGMCILRPPATATADIPAGTGARHSSAAKTTAVTNSVAVVVSVDGAVSVFSQGKRLLVDMT